MRCCRRSRSPKDCSPSFKSTESSTESHKTTSLPSRIGKFREKTFTIGHVKRMFTLVVSVIIFPRDEIVVTFFYRDNEKKKLLCCNEGQKSLFFMIFRTDFSIDLFNQSSMPLSLFSTRIITLSLSDYFSLILDPLLPAGFPPRWASVCAWRKFCSSAVANSL